MSSFPILTGKNTPKADKQFLSVIEYQERKLILKLI